MSQVERFADDVRDAAITRLPLPRAPHLTAADGPAGTADAGASDVGAQPPSLGANARDSRWPRWPAAWPDSSLRPR